MIVKFISGDQQKSLNTQMIHQMKILITIIKNGMLILETDGRKKIKLKIFLEN